MAKANLPVVRHKKKLRLKREQDAIGKSLYVEVTNIDGTSEVELIHQFIKEEDDGALFATWDNEIKNLL